MRFVVIFDDNPPTAAVRARSYAGGLWVFWGKALPQYEVAM
jgi:hypothetical protein